MAAMSNELLESIETKIAYLERANLELSDVVFRQQSEIQILALQLKAVLERLQSTLVDDTPRTADDERPPHY